MIYNLFPLPFLRASFLTFVEKWLIESLRPYYPILTTASQKGVRFFWSRQRRDIFFVFLEIYFTMVFRLIKFVFTNSVNI